MAKKNWEKPYTAKMRRSNKKACISTDVLGSYTGMGEDGEPPVQDADDL